jgi:hypothetical protein
MSVRPFWLFHPQLSSQINAAAQATSASTTSSSRNAQPAGSQWLTPDRDQEDDGSKPARANKINRKERKK